MTCRLGILADDLTGLAATLAEAAIGGRPAIIGEFDGNMPEDAILGLDLNCREAPPQEVRAVTSAGIARLHARGVRDILIKVDSLWRGNPLAMIEAACNAGAVAVFHDRFEAKAVPQVVFHGPLKAMLRLDLVCAARCDGVRLWVGGLDLVRALVWSSLRDPAPVLLMIGSREVAAQEQISQCRTAGIEILTGDVPSAFQRLQEMVAARRSVLFSGDGNTLPGNDKIAAENQFTAWAELLLRIPPDRCAGLILSGGHTASSVLGRLSTTAYRLTGDVVEYGLPVSVALDGAWRGTLLATKPGHFGRPSTLIEAVLVLQVLAAQRDAREKPRSGYTF